MITKIKIDGMHCASCKNLIEDVCKDIPGVVSCEVNFAEGVGLIEHDAPLEITALKNEIESIGQYTVTPLV